jgi:hypothetical protein
MDAPYIINKCVKCGKDTTNEKSVCLDRLQALHNGRTASLRRKPRPYYYYKLIES